jgi:hypothetical protein
MVCERERELEAEAGADIGHSLRRRKETRYLTLNTRWPQCSALNSQTIPTHPLANSKKPVALLDIPPLDDAWLAHLTQLSQAQLGSDHRHGEALVRAVQDVSQTYTRDRKSVV